MATSTPPPSGPRKPGELEDLVQEAAASVGYQSLELHAGVDTAARVQLASAPQDVSWPAVKGSFDPLLAVYGLTAGLGLLGIRRFVTGPMKTMRAIKPDTMNAMVWAGLGLSLWQRVQLYRLKKHYWEESQDTSTEFAARRIFRLTTLSVLCEDREPDSVGRQLFRELSEKLYREHQQTLDDPASLGWLDRRLAERNVLSLRDGQTLGDRMHNAACVLLSGIDASHWSMWNLLYLAGVVRVHGRDGLRSRNVTDDLVRFPAYMTLLEHWHHWERVDRWSLVAVCSAVLLNHVVPGARMARPLVIGVGIVGAAAQVIRRWAYHQYLYAPDRFKQMEVAAAALQIWMASVSFQEHVHAKSLSSDEAERKGVAERP